MPFFIQSWAAVKVTFRLELQMMVMSGSKALTSIFINICGSHYHWRPYGYSLRDMMVSNLSGLCFHLGPWCHEGPGCFQRTCLHLWSYHSWGLYWNPLPVQPPNATRKPEVYSTTCGLVSVWGPCLYQNRADLNACAPPWSHGII